MLASFSRLNSALRAAGAVAIAAALLVPIAAHAASTSPVVLSFSTVGDSRQDPVTFDKASVGQTLNGQDTMWLQNGKAIARILRNIQSQQ